MTFVHPWHLEDPSEMFPPGTYEVETDEELIEGLSFSAYRRTTCLIYMPKMPGRAGLSQTLQARPDELDAAMARDAAFKPPSP